ncbi:Serine/threonine-protein kinase [Rhynchospora pubera]|uniref:Receptor-like serine/threonine-protein kinase n=1 Tax=Rhynchospora pubera TaxID=906938 RepID=A0AAV8DNE7_9POAL|nr:Serine/threonine-protein kinase [Rhynchospora pubera]
MSLQMKNPFLFIILLQFFSNLLISSKAQTQSSLNKGSSQLVENYDQPFLVSQDGTFACGFYPDPVGVNVFYFSIWFTNSIEKTVVWTANRDSPVNGHGSKIKFGRDGNLFLRDFNGSEVWSTSTGGSSASTISLHDSGNLVINDRKGNTLWQSFDSPTDTLLPYQPLTKGKRVISAMVKGEIGSGYYSLYFDNDNVLRLMYDGPVISSTYWPNKPLDNVFQNGRTTYNSTRIAVLDRMGQFISSDGFSVSASDLGSGIRRLRMEYDGNFRMYSLNMSDGSWVVSWEALPELCQVHGLCGENGICDYLGDQMRCSCLPGYEMKNPNNWNEGCRPKFTYSCNKIQSRFVQIPQVDFYGFDLAYKEKISYDDCVELCLQNCTCTGFSYRLTGAGFCYPKGTLFNGYRSPNFPGSFYLRLPTDSNDSILSTSSKLDCTNNRSDILLGSPSMFGASQSNTTWTYMFTFIGILGALEILFLVIGWWYLFRDRDVPQSVEEGYKMISYQFRQFTYEELKDVTGKFKEEIGRGHTGVVYRGILDDKRVVAVKKLSDVSQGEEEFWAEVSVIGRINHINLVRMWGFCSERRHRLLVYEHLENQSLDKILFENERTLQWKERFKIALGIAKGLVYLHHECLEWIIHCDVKPENILLTRDFEPKIADFGLVKLTKRGEAGLNISEMRGTMGYMAPEWVLNLPITSKVDVYSYGVVLIEIIMGIRVTTSLSSDTKGGMQNFVSEVRHFLECNDEPEIAGLVDPKLRGQLDWAQLITMLRVATSCVEEERNRRPTMDEVVKDLMAFEERDDEPSSSSW